MNKTTNIFLLLLSFPAMLFSIYIGFDMPIEFFKTTGQFIPFKDEFFIAFGILYLLLIVRRSVKRWTGVKLVNATKKYKWNQPIAKERKSRVFMYLGLEIAVMSLLAISLLSICSDAWLIFIALIFGSLDNLLFLVLGIRKNSYRIGITSQAIVIADIEVRVLYFSGLREVSFQAETVFFDYVDGLQLSIPSSCLAKEEIADFRDVLEQQVNRDKVFFSESFKKMS